MRLGHLSSSEEYQAFIIFVTGGLYGSLLFSFFVFLLALDVLYQNRNECACLKFLLTSCQN